MNQPIHNAYWLSRFDSLLDSALAQHVPSRSSGWIYVSLSICLPPLWIPI